MAETRTNKDGGRMLFRFSSYNNGVSSARSYNNDNVLASIAFSGAPIGSYSYSWDANKNKTAETITGAMSGYSFTTGTTGYDDEDRLTRFTRGTLSQSWNLTSVGDWASFTSSGVGFQPAIGPRTHGPAHELTSVGGSPVTHDTKGNITSKPSSLNPTDTSSLAWDFDNRLDAIDVDGDTSVDVTFEYDALGRRVRKNDIVYALSGQQVAAGTAATSPTEKYVYASYIDEPVLKDGTGGLQYYHRNQQYSIIALTNAAGTIIERYAYDAYGNLTVLDASGPPFTLPNSDFNNGYTYTGRRYDPETGDYYYRATYYDSSLGRFCSRDPIGYVPGPNQYAYVSSQPLSRVDPSGLWDWPWDWDWPEWPASHGGPRWHHQPGHDASCPDDAVILARMAALSAKLMKTGFLDALPNYRSMPFQHCVWNCRMTKREGRPYAEDLSEQKEALDVAICKMGKSMSSRCFNRLSAAVRFKLVGYCCSAEQPADYVDNETGRKCGERKCADESDDRDCEKCCWSTGPALGQADGPGTSRPCGPHMPHEWEDLPGANSPSPASF